MLAGQIALSFYRKIKISRRRDLMKITIMPPDKCPCKSCRFEPECRWAHEYEVVECKDWGAKEEDEE